MQSDPNILEVINVNKSFAGVHALKNVNMTVRKGEVHGLIGENGAGKSTLMKILSGAYTKDSGEIIFEGNIVDTASPKVSEELGISIIYQELNLVNRLTIAENVFLGRYPKKGLIDWKQLNSDAKALFDKYEIEMDVQQYLREISIAKRQLVEIIKAVSINAKLVIMDEPSSSLTPIETEILFKVIRSLTEEGISVIFITHKLEEMFAICDRITILRDGEYVGTYDINNITKDEIIAYMIGRELTQQYPPRLSKLGDVIFEVRNLNDKIGFIKNVSFSVRAGEVLGFSGLVGAGRTETMRLVFGADRKHSGEVLIRGENVEIKHPKEAIKNKIGFLTEDRRNSGLLLNSSVKLNTTLVAPEKIQKLGMFFDYPKERVIAEDYRQMLNIVTPSINKKVMFLSGGNQQKVVLAKWLFADSEVVIFDEPTRGIDVGAKREIYEIINDLSSQGKAIIVVSSEMEEIIGISDRILVMNEGRIAGELMKEEFSQTLITEYAVGSKIS